MPTLRLACVIGCVLVAACGDDDGAQNLPDPSPYQMGDLWICPDAQGQMFTCQCDDGMDNDGDGQIDLGDMDCFDGSDNSEGTAVLGDTQCTDGDDNDGDGQTDSGDPECTGPLDNDENSFATGIPGDNMDACRQDCWFDGDSGSGNDGCLWDLACDPVAGPAYDCGPAPGGGRCDEVQDTRCVEFCSQFTPNGCDCFGCCDVFVDGVSHTVLLNAQCTTELINDATKCVPCTKVESCNNPCDPCEYCLGREPSGDCMPPDGGTTYECPADQTACDPSDPDGAACPDGYWCLTGCCAPNID